MTKIPYGKQDVQPADVDAVVAALHSDWLTQGPQVEAFEAATAAYTGAAHALAVSSGTAGLHLGLLALGVGPGDRVWTSPNTFVATANAARLCGAAVDFVDIDPRTYNLDAGRLAAKLAAAEAAGALPKVVIPVHFAGQPCDMAEIAALARRYGAAVLEDACHAVGAAYAGAKVGACAYSDAAVFSYHPVKIVTTGEGGMLVTNRAEVHARAALLRTHGVTRDPAMMTGEPHGGWYYEQTALGLNYRITDLQCALGLSQMTRLDAYVARREALAGRYDEALADLPLTLPFQAPGRRSARHLYPVHVGTAAKRRAVYDRLHAAGILVNVHYIPVHTHPYYRNLGFAAGNFPEAERYYAGALSLPLYPALGEAEQDRVIAQLRAAVAAA
jgi:UDP-4-amino-4,6-dideoxy-N-acetyl-beta-L-altrosamine transaminase